MSLPYQKIIVKLAMMAFVILSIINFSKPGMASLTCPTDPSGNYIYSLLYDDVSELYWQRYWEQFVSKTYDEQISAIAGLSLSPSNTAWRMALQEDIDSLILNNTDGKIAVSFEPDYIINARYDEVAGQNQHYRLYVYQGYTSAGHYVYTMNDMDRYSFIGAWVCADALTVPVPATFFIFGFGLLGLAGLRRKKN